MSSEVIESIKKQVEGIRDNEVYVLEIYSIQIEELTPEIQAALERYQSLQMLSINNCGLKSLRYFPRIPSIMRLDLVSNKLKGDQLANLKPLKYLQTLYLSGNLLTEVDELKPLTFMDHLLQLDLVCNDVVTIPAYREKIFALFPSLTVLDSLNRESQFNKPNMSESVKRVRPDLFEKVNKPAAAKIKAAIVRTSSILSTLSNSSTGDNKKKAKIVPPVLSISAKSKKIKKEPPKPKDRSKAVPAVQPSLPVSSRGKGKGGKAALIPGGRRNISSRLGLWFPVGRITRYLRETKMFARISRGAGIYVTSVLDYLACEFLEVAGNEAKSRGKKRIDPKSLRSSLLRDEELRKLVGTFIMPEGGFEPAFARL